MVLVGGVGVAATFGYFVWRYGKYGKFLVVTRQWLPMTLALCMPVLAVVATYGLVTIARGVHARMGAGSRARIADSKRALPTARVARARKEDHGAGDRP